MPPNSGGNMVPTESEFAHWLASEYRLFLRPSEVLHDLPTRFRWEFTRRHPYYLTYWKLATRPAANSANNSSPAHLKVARFLLSHIGVFGEPVDPSTELSEMGALDDFGFLSGAVQPISLRAMAATLINALDGKDLQALGYVIASGGLETAGDEVPNPIAQKQEALHALQSIRDEKLDSYPDAPLFYVHLRASSRTILKSMDDIVRRWKARRNIPEKRVHTSNLGECLQVWDTREGWANGHYRVTDEKTFGQIAKQLGIPRATVISKYQRAFEWLTGHSFTPQNWVILLAPLKHREGRSIPDAHLRRYDQFSRATSSVAPGSQSTFGGGSLAESVSAVHDDRDTIDQCLDIRELIGSGCSDEEICSRLELSDPSLVVFIRNRLGED
jgi:hypothetical protein